MSLELIGWIGSIAFAICAAPQAWESYKTGKSDGITWGFLLLWLIGEIFTLIYVWPKILWPLIFNYLGNIFFILIVVRYKLYPRSLSE